mmetsp:Transcript_10985/g.15486  ORF Transcript_10985/g.15486 Transcript_10985/m.15486 type:complete len:219 (-) Transcript_10985:309-965(-)
MASEGGGESGAVEGEAGGEVLVSEFPPPPFYYRQAASLIPPEIPIEALERGSKRAAAAAAKAQAEAERIRLEQAGAENNDNTDEILGGIPTKEEEEEGEVVAVFGEIVEDPLLVDVKDNCEDPKVIRDEVRRLNKVVVQGFVKLVQELVHRPQDNKKCRDELSHNVFLMLQECNKFREHQSRELLIEVLEKQLEERREVLKELQEEISRSNELLGISD